MAHVWTAAYEARLISLRCEKSEREGVAANERDGARNGDGQMFAVSLKSREGCPVGALPRPRLWNALTHFRVQKKREPDRQTDGQWENTGDAWKLCFACHSYARSVIPNVVLCFCMDLFFCCILYPSLLLPSFIQSTKQMLWICPTR